MVFDLMFDPRFGEMFEFGEGCANLLELSGLSVAERHSITWERGAIDLTELARKRWVERWSMDRLAEHFGKGRTAIVRNIGKIRANPDLVADGQVRLRIHRRKNLFMGRRA